MMDVLIIGNLMGKSIHFEDSNFEILGHQPLGIPYTESKFFFIIIV